MKMQFFVLVCVIMGSWASPPNDEPLSLIQSSAQFVRYMSEAAIHDSGKQPTPTTTISKSCSVPAECVLNLTQIKQDDMHGLVGKLHYANVCKNSEGKVLDLVITSESADYIPLPRTHKESDKLGRISLGCGTEAIFRFTFVDAITGAPAKVKSVDITWLDMDGQDLWGWGWLEQLEISDYYSYSLHVNSILHRKIENGKAVFTSQQETIPNPDPDKGMTPIQLKTSVQVRYEGVSTFTTKMKIMPAPKGRANPHNRNFFFTGAATLSETCTTTVCLSTPNKCAMTFSKSNLVQNNLGGVGPDTGVAELRYGSICTVNGGTVLDLVVTSTSPYTPKDAKKTGVSGKYGNVNLLGGHSVDLKFSFVKSGTLEPIVLDATDMTILDLDGYWNGQTSAQESVTASDYASSTLGENATVTFTPESTSWPTKGVFTSTEVGYGWDNPKDPMTLTPLQASRSISLSYAKVDHFAVSFGVTGDASIGGRNFIFAGKSSINSVMCTSTKDP